jgi:hypothetical protein
MMLLYSSRSIPLRTYENPPIAYPMASSLNILLIRIYTPDSFITIDRCHVYVRRRP